MDSRVGWNIVCSNCGLKMVPMSDCPRCGGLETEHRPDDQPVEQVWLVHVPTRYMTLMEVFAVTPAEAIAKAKLEEGKFKKAVFVEYDLHELSEEDVDEPS